MNCLALIPAVDRSPEGPRALLAKSGDGSLLGQAIEAARDVEIIDRVVVCTNDSAVMGAAQSLGAEVIGYPTDGGDASPPLEQVLLHSLVTLANQDGYRAALVCLVQAGASAEILAGAIATLTDSHADSCFVATESPHPIWLRRRDDLMRLGDISSPSELLSTGGQCLVETGIAYVVRVSQLVADRQLFCGETVAHVVDAPTGAHKHPGRVYATGPSQQAVQSRRSMPADVGAVVFDFDGVFTDNRVLVMQDGTEGVLCSRGDGLGLGHLAAAGVEILILSKERNPVVSARAQKLKLDCLQGIDDKPKALCMWLEEKGVPLERTIYVGNDANDVACMELVGFSACPADAHDSALAVADLVLSRVGGFGAVRELCDRVVAGTRR